MSEYDNELRGALFKNKNMRPDKKDPEYKGSATIGGVEYWVSSWINKSKAGEKYMSLNFKAKDEQSAAPAKAAPPKPAELEFDDAIPF